MADPETSRSAASAGEGKEATQNPIIMVPLSSSRLGRYQLSLEIARGGMATVYLARVEGRAGIHRFVAVKMLHPHLTRDPDFVDMFLDEARIASRVQHANLCSVIDYDASDAGHYLVMEFLAGEPLSHVFRAMVRRAKASPEQNGSPEQRAARVARLIADACEGLHAAHELTGHDGEPLGVVHRDISPENVFLTYDGVAKVVDFGVATAAIQKHHTRTGVLKGKYAYISPEVLRGRRPDRRADIWSLGVVLWELLTLKRLFHRSTDLGTLKSVSEHQIRPPSQVRPELPSYYDDIVQKALARDPEQRYRTARELARDLTQVLASRQIPVGLADLSEWMDGLFPSGRACKLQLLEIASRMDDATPVRESRVMDRISLEPHFYEEPTRFQERRRVPRTNATRPRRSLPPIPPQPPPRPLPAFHAPIVRPKRRGLFAGAAAATLAVGASLALFHPFTPTGELAAAPQVAKATTEVSSVTPRAPAAPAAPLRVPGAPYVVEIERQVESDPSSVVLRIRPESETASETTAPPKTEATPPPKPEPAKSPTSAIRPRRERAPEPPLDEPTLSEAAHRPRTL